MALHERFSEYTKEELVEIKRKVCISHNCPYLARMSDYQSANAITNNFCDYISYEGHSRGCMPDDCEHYKDENVDKNKRLKYLKGDK